MIYELKRIGLRIAYSLFALAAVWAVCYAVTDKVAK